MQIKYRIELMFGIVDLNTKILQRCCELFTWLVWSIPCDYLYHTIWNESLIFKITYYDHIYTLFDIACMDGSFSHQLCKTIQKEKRNGNFKNQIHSIEEISWSSYKILCIGFRRVGGNEQIIIFFYLSDFMRGNRFQIHNLYFK